MQTLLGLSADGRVRHMEPLTSLTPSRLMRLALLRWTSFERIEVWEEVVCVLRLPPLATAARER